MTGITWKGAMSLRARLWALVDRNLCQCKSEYAEGLRVISWRVKAEGTSTWIAHI